MNTQQHVTYNNLGQPVGTTTTSTYVSGNATSVPLHTNSTGIVGTGLIGTTSVVNTGYTNTNAGYTNTTGYVNTGIVPPMGTGYDVPTNQYHMGGNTTVTQTQGSYNVKIMTTNGATLGWQNPNHLQLPLIGFEPTCKKCHGSGSRKSRFGGHVGPCTRCYTRAGYCKKCFGTAASYKKGKPCTRCDAGKRLIKQNKALVQGAKGTSSSSSDSDTHNKH